MGMCRIHKIRWRDDEERGEWFECPECERIREEEDRSHRVRDREDEEDEEWWEEEDEE